MTKVFEINKDLDEKLKKELCNINSELAREWKQQKVYFTYGWEIEAILETYCEELEKGKDIHKLGKLLFIEMDSFMSWDDQPYMVSNWCEEYMNSLENLDLYKDFRDNLQAVCDFDIQNPPPCLEMNI